VRHVGSIDRRISALNSLIYINGHFERPLFACQAIDVGLLLCAALWNIYCKAYGYSSVPVVSIKLASAGVVCLEAQSHRFSHFRARPLRFWPFRIDTSAISSSA
jgi:hypothetical protein